MSALKKLATTETLADEKDSVGGGGGLLDSGLYNMTVNMAYLGESDGGATSVNLVLKSSDGRELKQTIYITSGRAKGQKTYYEKDGVKHGLPGFLLVNHLCLLTIGKEITDLDTEEKVIKLWNYDSKSEVPTKVQVVTDLLGQEIIAGVLRQTVDKRVKNDSGVYVASGETRDENEIDKFFRVKDSMTVAEIKAQAPEATFINTWREKHTGVTRNKATGASGNAGAPGAAAPAQPKKSLFG